MRIFNSSVGDPMLLDSQSGLSVLQSEIGRFIASSESAAFFPAETTGNPEPADEFLKGLRISKGPGEIRLSISSDRWLELYGSVNELEQFHSKLALKESSGHTHWYGKPVSLIIETDDTWVESN
jgi:hypothetical protein